MSFHNLFPRAISQGEQEWLWGSWERQTGKDNLLWWEGIGSIENKMYSTYISSIVFVKSLLILNPGSIFLNQIFLIHTLTKTDSHSRKFTENPAVLLRWQGSLCKAALSMNRCVVSSNNTQLPYPVNTWSTQSLITGL